MFESVSLAGLGAKVKRDWAKPRTSPFRRHFRSSITRHWREFFKILALQCQGTVQPHVCASRLKYPSCAAPVEPAKGSVSDRVQYVTLINRKLVTARPSSHLVPPICTRFPETPATVNDPYFCRRRRAVSDLKTLKWLQGLAQGSPATISGHPTAVAPGHRRTTIKPRRTERTRIRAHSNISTMFIAEAPSCM